MQFTEAQLESAIIELREADDYLQMQARRLTYVTARLGTSFIKTELGAFPANLISSRLRSTKLENLTDQTSL